MVCLDPGTGGMPAAGRGQTSWPCRERTTAHGDDRNGCYANPCGPGAPGLAHLGTGYGCVSVRGCRRLRLGLKVVPPLPWARARSGGWVRRFQQPTRRRCRRRRMLIAGGNGGEGKLETCTSAAKVIQVPRGSRCRPCRRCRRGERPSNGGVGSPGAPEGVTSAAKVIQVPRGSRCRQCRR